MASASGLLVRLHEVDGRVGSVMLLGHYPSVKELALSLASRGLDLGRLTEKFPTAGLATLAFPGSWSELAPGGAELIAFVTPEELEASRAS